MDMSLPVKDGLLMAKSADIELDLGRYELRRDGRRV